MAVVTTNLGAVTAYADAVAGGYKGTKSEWQALMADYATVGTKAAQDAQTASTEAQNASTAAQTATTKADEASQSASHASASAKQAQDYAEAIGTPDTTLTQAGKAADAKATGDLIFQQESDISYLGLDVSNLKKGVSGLNSDVSELKSGFTALESDGVVPSAEQILTDKGVTDSVPYHYRKTGGDGADRLYDQIVGGTVCWNQLADFSASNIPSASNGINYAYTDGMSVKITGTATALEQRNGWFGLSEVTNLPLSKLGNKVLIDTGIVSGSFDGSVVYGIGSAELRSIGTPYIGPLTNSNVDQIRFQHQITSGTVCNDLVVSINVFDLTAMFGTEIADYIYQLEQTTAGAGVAFFKALFPNDYYEYNAGELVSVSGLSEHKMVGFNQWDEKWEVGTINVEGNNTNSTSNIRSKNYIPCFPNTSYYGNFPTVTGVSSLFFYDEDGNFLSKTSSPQKFAFVTPESAKFMRFAIGASYGTAYKNDICINLSDHAKNGTYEPYKAHSYPLDSTLTLRGLFKLDANNQLYADGDVYEYTGKVTRNTILRAYQSGDESLANAITDGTNTVVYSANASTEQATPYQHLQQCDPNGTEEFVSTGIVPVGHETRYPENLRAKIEGLPWDFSSIIAPTEKTTTASRNYTTGSLLIMGNTLYKVTANIANGGTITPNTNVTATTLSEILSALAQ